MSARAPTSQAEWNEVALGFLDQRREAPWRSFCDRLYSTLLDRWLPSSRCERALKTDLFDEAVHGGLVERLEAAAQSVHGLDLSTPIAREATRRHASLRAALADARALPYEDGAFDLVFSNSTLDHFQSVTDIDRALAELARVTREGGTLFLTLDNLDNPLIRLRSALPNTFLRRTGLVPYFVGATHGREGTSAALERAGFAVDEMTAILHNPRVATIPLARAVAGRKWLAQRLPSALMVWEHLERLPTRFLTGHYVAARATRVGAEA